MTVDPHGGKIAHGTATAELGLTASATGRKIVYGTATATLGGLTVSATGYSVRAMVEAAAEAVEPGTLTAADVRTIVAAVVAAQPRRDPVARLALVVAVVALVVQWLSYRQDSTEYARPEPPPSVTVIAPQPDITIIVPPAPAPQPEDDQQ